MSTVELCLDEQDRPTFKNTVRVKIWLLHLNSASISDLKDFEKQTDKLAFKTEKENLILSTIWFRRKVKTSILAAPTKRWGFKTVFATKSTRKGGLYFLASNETWKEFFWKISLTDSHRKNTDSDLEKKGKRITKLEMPQI